MEEILRYFPYITHQQTVQFDVMGRLYKEWNEKVNVVSRKDIDNIFPHHILHSLSIAKFFTPAPGTRILDLGTGGGFPGIPLAVLWPDCRFHMIDRIAKKIKVAQSIATELKLDNVTFQHGDAGECHERFDYVISRAVMCLPDLIRISARNIQTSSAVTPPAGLICLKGGDLTEEIAAVRRPVLKIPISDWFSDSFFSTKYLLYVNFGK